MSSGDHQTESEVLREGLRLLEVRDILKRLSVSSIVELEQKLMGGAASLDRGEGVKGDEAFKRVRQGTKERKTRG